MSSSDDATAIYLTDDRETVFEKMQTYAYSGGRTSVEEHRQYGGDPEIDVAYQYLYYFFEPDDETVEWLAQEYRSSELLSGELKKYAADRIAEFLEKHQQRRKALDPVETELEPYRLTMNERERALRDWSG